MRPRWPRRRAGGCAASRSRGSPASGTSMRSLAVSVPTCCRRDAEDLRVLRLPQQLAAAAGACAAGTAAPGAALPARLLFEGPRAAAERRATGRRRSGWRARTQLVLAGGLDADNVADGHRRACAPSGSMYRAAWRSGPASRARPKWCGSPRRRARACEMIATGATDPRDHRVARASDPLADLIAGRFPDARGRFGPFGGRYVPETLIPALERLEQGVREHLHDGGVPAGARAGAASWVGRPTALTLAGAAVGALGRARSGSSARISRTPARTRSTTPSGRRCWPGGSARGASSPRPAPASTASRARRPARGSGCPAPSTWAQSTWSGRRPTSGACACSARPSCRCTAATARCARPSMRRCATGWPIRSTPTICSARRVGPHPYPYLVRELQAVIGREARAQMLERTGALPDAVIACVGGGSNSIGAVPPLRRRTAAWSSSASRPAAAAAALGENAATLAYGRPGVLHGSYSMLLQDENGQIQETHSVSAGLDYPGVGPEHALLAATGRVRYETASDAEALEAVTELLRVRGHPAGASRARMRWPARSAGPPSIPAARCSSASPAAATRTCRRCSRRCCRRSHDETAGTIDGASRPRGRATIAAAIRARAPAAASGSAGAGRVSDRGLSEPRALHASICRRIAAAADVVEIGVPFTDPMADGVTIQRASQAALAQGVSLRWILAQLETMAPRQAPLLLMSYLNPLLAFGLERAGRRPLRGPASRASSCRICRSMRARSCARRSQVHGLALVQMVTPVTRADASRADLSRAARDSCMPSP